MKFLILSNNATFLLTPYDSRVGAVTPEERRGLRGMEGLGVKSSTNAGGDDGTERMKHPLRKTQLEHFSGEKKTLLAYTAS